MSDPTYQSPKNLKTDSEALIVQEALLKENHQNPCTSPAQEESKVIPMAKLKRFQKQAPFKKAKFSGKQNPLIF